MEATTNKQVHLPSLVLWIMQRRCASIIKFGRGRSIKKFCEDEGYDYRQVLQTGGEREIRIRFSDPVCNAMKIYEKNYKRTAKTPRLPQFVVRSGVPK